MVVWLHIASSCSLTAAAFAFPGTAKCTCGRGLAEWRNTQWPHDRFALTESLLCVPLQRSRAVDCTVVRPSVALCEHVCSRCITHWQSNFGCESTELKVTVKRPCYTLCLCKPSHFASFCRQSVSSWPSNQRGSQERIFLISNILFF